MAGAHEDGFLQCVFEIGNAVMLFLILSLQLLVNQDLQYASLYPQIKDNSYGVTSSVVDLQSGFRLHGS